MGKLILFVLIRLFCLFLLVRRGSGEEEGNVDMHHCLSVGCWVSFLFKGRRIALPRRQERPTPPNFRQTNRRR